MNLQHILISRTDSIGDVMLTLPLCSWLKEEFPEVKISFLGRNYTKAIIESYQDVDTFVSWDDIENNPTNKRIDLIKQLELDAIVHVFPRKEIATLAKKAKVPMRIGTSHRNFHLLTCNHRVNFTRKRSNLHESQLNFELLRPLGLREIPSLERISSYTTKFQVKAINLPAEINTFLSQHSENIILHPKSQGSALEWPIDNYIKVAQHLALEGKGVIFSGTEKEGQLFRKSIPKNEHIFDSTGKLTLDQLLFLIDKCDSLVACSTGPLHIAGYLNKRAVGLFVPKRPIHPGRWQPLGPNVRVLLHDPHCNSCKGKKVCSCIEKIDVAEVIRALKN